MFYNAIAPPPSLTDSIGMSSQPGSCFGAEVLTGEGAADPDRDAEGFEYMDGTRGTGGKCEISTDGFRREGDCWAWIEEAVNDEEREDEVNDESIASVDGVREDDDDMDCLDLEAGAVNFIKFILC